MKGIILAGGAGTRLAPLTKAISKPLLPVYDKPMIYYPLATLMQSGITEVLIISVPEDLDRFEALLGNGESLGLKITYAEEPIPRGIAPAFMIGEEFIGNDNVCLILGDNIFYSPALASKLITAVNRVAESDKAVVFGYYVNNPDKFGVVEFGPDKKAISIEEKPKSPKSNYAVVGLYYYPNDVIEVTKKIKPSERGELEITSVNQKYLESGRLEVEIMEKETAWFDAGTHNSLLEAAHFIQKIEMKTGIKVACLEEIAFEKGLIGRKDFEVLTDTYKNEYGKYLKQVVQVD